MCADFFDTSTARRVSASVAGAHFHMYVYNQHAGIRDIVSESIKRTGSWEKSDTETVLSLLSCPQLASCDDEKGVLLDIGANIG